MMSVCDIDILQNGIMAYVDIYGQINMSITQFNTMLERCQIEINEYVKGFYDGEKKIIQQFIALVEKEFDMQDT